MVNIITVEDHNSYEWGIGQLATSPSIGLVVSILVVFIIKVVKEQGQESPWIEGLAFAGFLAMVAFFVYSEFFQKKKEH